MKIPIVPISVMFLVLSGPHVIDPQMGQRGSEDSQNHSESKMIRANYSKDHSNMQLDGITSQSEKASIDSHRLRIDDRSNRI